MKVVLIGTGNVATVLGKKIFEAGHEIIQVVGRNMIKSKELAALLNADYADDLTNINDEADIYIIAVADDYVEKISERLKLKSQLVVHTAGALSKHVLKNSSDRYGILYPLQSLRKELPAPLEIPVLVDGSDNTVCEQLINFASTWSAKVEECSDEERVKLHIAAVITSNFTNHLYSLANKYCNQEKLNFSLLSPLIEETARRIKVSSPIELQTGPAIRGDFKTIEKHLEYLHNYPDLKSVYNVLTNSIIKESSNIIDTNIVISNPNKII